jgi:hypothetical protein
MTPEQEQQVTEVETGAASQMRRVAAREGRGRDVFHWEASSAQKIRLPSDPSPWGVNGKVVGQGMLSRNTRMAAALGVPALTLPTSLTTEGLPVSFEFDAIRGR